MNPILIAALITVGAVALLVLAVLLLRLYMLAPGRRNSEMEKYKSVKFAHRGLHDGGKAENSLSAFAAAKAAGYGIELDVRLTKDGEMVVFHDSTLNRICGVEGRVADFTLDELRKFRLSDTADTIPTLREVLDLVDGAIPMLIEIKQEAGEGGVPEKFIEVIEGYNGDFIVESFNPFTLRKVMKARPDVLRGILSTDYSKSEKHKGKLLFKLLTKLYLNFLMRPDFIAYEKTGASVPTLRYIRKKFNTPLIAWTVKSEEEELRALGDGFDTVIFENYLAKK